MGVRSRLMTGILASALTLGGGTALAQDASPEASPEQDEILVSLQNADGEPVANASLIETDDGVAIAVTAGDDTGLEPGEHGFHIHETGLCEAPFESAGGHFNPTDASHGDIDDDESHAGDLGNLTVEDDGTIQFEITTDKITLQEGEDNSLADDDGSALLIHAGEDDLESDPSGESGDRLVCGVIFPPADSGTPVATPES